MKYSYINKWILTNIYNNYIHDLPPNQSLYDELYNEDDFKIINEDNEYFEIIPDTTTLIYIKCYYHKDLKRNFNYILAFPDIQN